ncbi:hypothetical protein, partial [Faecalibaculum rodentium]|uniref:hypothetical protein n=1 Tax=Faecalibaculum rodentium TaxID=1702221 RepID=UPI0025B1CC95
EEMINGRMAVNAYDCPSHGILSCFWTVRLLNKNRTSGPGILPGLSVIRRLPAVLKCRSYRSLFLVS